MPWESFTAIVLGLIALVGTIVTTVLQRPRLRRIEDAAAETREQVSNDHSSNLREDVDRIERKVDRINQVFTEHIVASEKQQTAQDQRLTNFIADIRAELRGEPAKRKERRWPRLG